MRQIEGTLEEVAAMIAEADAEYGYPRRGKPVGKGPHPVIPETWDGTGERPPGWQVTWAYPEEHPRQPGVYSMPLKDAAHETRLEGKRVHGRTLARGDFTTRDESDWTREDARDPE
jgi:hypothetical protein